MYLVKYKIFKKTDSPQNVPWSAWNEFWNNCWSKLPGVGWIFAPTTEEIQKRKTLAKKVMAKDAPLVIYIATLTTPDETSDRKSVKKSFNCHFFFCPKKRFFQMFLRDTIGRLFRFCAKSMKFHTSNSKKICKKNFKKENFFPKMFLW